MWFLHCLVTTNSTNISSVIFARKVRHVVPAVTSAWLMVPQGTWLYKVKRPTEYSRTHEKTFM